MCRILKAARSPYFLIKIFSVSVEEGDEKPLGMNFEDKNDEQKFLADEKYYKGLDNYCLGKTHEDAAEIINKIVEDREKIKAQRKAKK